MKIFKMTKNLITSMYGFFFISLLFFLNGFFDAQSYKNPYAEIPREPYAMKNPTLPSPKMLYGIDVEPDPRGGGTVFPEKEKIGHGEEHEIEKRPGYGSQFGDIGAINRESTRVIPIHGPQDCPSCAISLDIHREIIRIQDEEPISLPDEYYEFKKDNLGLVELIWGYIHIYGAVYMLGYFSGFIYGCGRQNGGGGGHNHG